MLSPDGRDGRAGGRGKEVKGLGGQERLRPNTARDRGRERASEKAVPWGNLPRPAPSAPHSARL